MDLIIKLKNTNEIRERVLFKNLNTDHNFAELLVDVKNPLNNDNGTLAYNVLRV